MHAGLPQMLRSSPWSAASVAVFSLVLISGCENSRTGLEPAITTYDVGITGSPSIAHTFSLTNRGPGVISIAAVEKSCACLTPTLSQSELSCGERLQVTMQVDIGGEPRWKRRDFVHFLRVKYFGESNGSSLLRMQGSYLPHVYLPKAMEPIELEEMKSGYVSRPLGMSIDKSASLTSAQVDGIEWLNADIQETNDIDDFGRRKSRLLVSGYYDAKYIRLPVHGQIRLAYACGSPDELMIPLSIIPAASSSISVEPDRISFGIITAGTSMARKLIFKWRTATGLEIEAIKTPTFLTAEYDVKTHGNYREAILKCQLRCNSDLRTIDDSLVISFSNGYVTKSVVVPISGAIKEE